MRLYPLLGSLTQWLVDYCMWASSCCVIPWEVYRSINLLDTWCFFKAFLVLQWLAWFYVHLIACYCWSIKNLVIILFPTTLSMSTTILTLRYRTFLFFWTVQWGATVLLNKYLYLALYWSHKIRINSYWWKLIVVIAFYIRHKFITQ